MEKKTIWGIMENWTCTIWPAATLDYLLANTAIWKFGKNCFLHLFRKSVLSGCSKRYTCFLLKSIVIVIDDFGYLQVIKLYWEYTDDQKPFESSRFKDWIKKNPPSKKSMKHENVFKNTLKFYLAYFKGNASKVTAAVASKLYCKHCKKFIHEYTYCGYFTFSCWTIVDAASNATEIPIPEVIKTKAQDVFEGKNKVVWNKIISLPKPLDEKFPLALLDTRKPECKYL